MTSKEKFEKTLDKKLREIKESFMANYENHIRKTNKPILFDWSHLDQNELGWNVQTCSHPQHNPPNMLYLPSGQVLRHICPACRKVTTVHGSGCFM